MKRREQVRGSYLAVNQCVMMWFEHVEKMDELMAKMMNSDVVGNRVWVSQGWAG